MLDCCLPLETIKMQGTTLEQVGVDAQARTHDMLGNWRLEIDTVLDCCLPLETINMQGTTLEQVGADVQALTHGMLGASRRNHLKSATLQWRPSLFCLNAVTKCPCFLRQCTGRMPRALSLNTVRVILASHTNAQAACLARCNGAEVSFHRYGTFSVDEFRKQVWRVSCMNCSALVKAPL